ncbi:squalene/phytoene synthase family protein [Metabacillus litoralis]|uniref:squalene/phytoene synthase family protein n=1 Tax=Metabacillus TaxID=2675233 RepID=UPI000EF625A0|nr:squalene/phytoene synthase family protein [Metabacillus litoralis]MCM3164930.1 squalene/phytoene synthase family protein [Metabacillus litoralis]MCM3410395.1 squalene/phytoene synthase family protein [Metabacillus litoralis]
MKELKVLQKEAMEVLKATSRTFYIPITFLKKDLKDAVAVAYLAMRAIDEIEDHQELSNDVKHDLLMEVSQLLLEENFNNQKYNEVVSPYKDVLPEVTLRLADWLSLTPTGAKSRVQAATSEMAMGMAKWSKAGWDIKTREDLDDYTYYVAGLVGVMLSDLWQWHDGIETDRDLAIGYGRGLQAVNILRNQHEDMDERGVSFVPDGWNQNELFSYANENLAMANEYIKSINKRTILLFCRLPLAIAHKTLKALKDGREKISRAEVEKIVQEVQVD